MRAFATRAAAIGALLIPTPLIAQEAAPNIAVTHAASAHSGKPQTRANADILPANPSATSPNLAIPPTGDAVFLGTIKSRSAGSEWADGGFHLTAMRGRSASATTAAQSFEYRRFAMMALGADVTQNISARDTLTLSGTYAAARRRPAFVVSHHRNYRTDEQMVALHWTHDDRFDLGAALFDTGPAKPRSAVERIADLAGGAPRAVRGWGLTASLYPSGKPETLSVGLDVRDQQDRDIQHHDARVQIVLKKRF